MLVVWPPEIPVSANCFTYHYIDFIEPISYLVNLGYDVDFIDMGLLNQHKQELYLKFTDRPNKIAIYCDFHLIQSAIESIKLARIMSPTSEILIYGPIISLFSKNILEIENGLLVGCTGDYETILENFYTDNYKERIVDGYWLDSKNMQPINLNLFNPHDYQRLIDLDRNRNQELNVGIGVSRGCSYSCEYCRTTLESDSVDRRVPIDKIMNFIDNAQRNHNINSFKFISPNFAQNREWVFDFLDAVKKKGVTWKCCTRVEYFDDESFAELFKEAGCVSVSVGLESYDETALSGIKRVNSNIYKGIHNLSKHRISIKGMVMLGIPGSDFMKTKEWIASLEKMGVAVRPTIYTDYKNIKFADLPFADKRLCVHDGQNVEMVEMCLDRNGKMY